MAREKTCQVSFGVEHARYIIGEESELNGQMVTVEDAIERFTDGNGLGDRVARIDGLEADLDTPLRDGDVIVVATAQSASGGYKGA